VAGFGLHRPVCEALPHPCAIISRTIKIECDFAVLEDRDYFLYILMRLTKSSLLPTGDDVNALWALLA